MAEETKTEEVAEQPEKGESLNERMLHHLKKTSCTSWSDEKQDYEWVSLKAGPTKLGKVTGSVGVELYFRLVRDMGIVFFVMFLLSLPLFIFNCAGAMLESTSDLSQALGAASIANLGHCPSSGCRTADDYMERCVWSSDCGDDGLKVKDIAQLVGILDGAAILTFVAFGVIFGQWKVPNIVREHDENVLSPADFTVVLAVCPKVLGGSTSSEEHKAYSEKLRSLFVEVLKTAKKDPIDDDEAVSKITLVREYDGQISQFMDKGNLLVQLDNAKALKDKYSADGKVDKAQKQEAAIKKLEDKIAKIDESIAHGSTKPEDERGVCRAFVTFKKIDYYDKALWEYRFAKFTLFRLCQSGRLKLDGHRICIHPAQEPRDLYWENLDFNIYKRWARKALVLIITILVLMVCAFLLVSIKSSTVVATSNTYKEWIIAHEPSEDDSTAGNCLKICSWDMFESTGCGSGSSSGRNITRYFDATSDTAVSSGTTLGSALPGTVADCSNPVWQSVGCSTSGDLSQDWIGVEFEDAMDVNCMKLVQEATSAVEYIRVYGCVEDAIPAPANRTNWVPSDSCIPMLVTTSPTTSSDEGVDTGSMKLVKDDSCDTTVSLEKAQAALLYEDDITVNCFCTQQLALDTELIKPPYETPAQLVCEQWSTDLATTYGLMGLGIVGVVILNQVLLVVFTMLIKFERPMSVSDYTRSQLGKLFAAQFVNTALLTYLVNQRFSNVPAVLQIITEPLSLGKGAYYEATGLWFDAVGSALMITVLSQVFSTTITPVIMSRIVAPLKLKFALWRGTVVSETALKKLWEKPEWNLALRCAQTMNVVCCVVFYSGGMPAMYFIGMMYCLFAYWLDKYTLLRGSRRPPTYSADVILLCMHFFPLGVILHALFAAFVLGNPNLLPSDWSQFEGFAQWIFDCTMEKYTSVREEWAVASTAERDDMFEDYMRTRLLDFARESTWALLLIFLALLVYYVVAYLHDYLLEPVLSPVVTILKEFFYRTGCIKPKRTQSETEKSYDEVIDTFKQAGYPENYDMIKNPAYKDAAIAVLDHHERISSISKASEASSAPSADVESEAKHEEAVV